MPGGWSRQAWPGVISPVGAITPQLEAMIKGYLATGLPRGPVVPLGKLSMENGGRLSGGTQPLLQVDYRPRPWLLRAAMATAFLCPTNNQPFARG
jgi:hypothetical protein